MKMGTPELLPAATTGRKGRTFPGKQASWGLTPRLQGLGCRGDHMLSFIQIPNICHVAQSGICSSGDGIASHVSHMNVR